jgi:hypothetical protein
MVTFSAPAAQKRISRGLLYAWSGFAVMWAVWTCFIIFLCEPRRLLPFWPMPTVDGGVTLSGPLAALIDLALVGLFGLQHSRYPCWFGTLAKASPNISYGACSHPAG